MYVCVYACKEMRVEFFIKKVEVLLAFGGESEGFFLVLLNLSLSLCVWCHVAFVCVCDGALHVYKLSCVS